MRAVRRNKNPKTPEAPYFHHDSPIFEETKLKLAKIKPKTIS